LTVSDVERWDAIVVGAGLGGLTAAAYLTAAGRRTLLLEQYDVVGGCTHVFRRKRKWEFEVGMHYLGDCGPDGQIPTMLRGLGLDDRIEFLPMDADGFDTLCYPDVTLRVPKGWDNYLANVIDAFPGEERAIRRYLGVMRQLGEAMDRSATPASLGGMAAFAARGRLASAWALLPLNRLLETCGLSDRARAAMSVECGSYVCPPSRTPVALHAAFLHNYIKDGAYYPKGGGQVFAAHMTDLIRTHGGDVRARARVERILVHGGRVSGVRLTTGEELFAPVVVSNADIKRTYLDMVGREHLSGRTVRRVAGWRMTLPFVNVYLGLDIDLADRMPNTNLFSMPTWDSLDLLWTDEVQGIGSRASADWHADLAGRLGAYVHSSTVKDPAGHYAPTGHSAVEVMVPFVPDYRAWGVQRGPHDGEDYSSNPRYLEAKEAITEIMIDRAADVIPGLRGHVVYREAATPITQERYTLSTGGAAYGIEMSIGQFGPFRPKPRTEIAGLYLAGASQAWGPGVEGAMLSGLHAAGAALDRDLAREVHAGVVLGDRTKLTGGGPGWDPLLASKRMSRKPRVAAVQEVTA
jgi:phytoene dehydrogenase-like protein